MTNFRIIPIRSHRNERFFVPTQAQTDRTVIVDGTDQITGALRTGKPIDLIGLVNTGYNYRHSVEYIPTDDLKLLSLVFENLPGTNSTYEIIDVTNSELVFSSRDEDSSRILEIDTQLTCLLGDSTIFDFRLTGRFNTQTGELLVSADKYKAGAYHLVGFTLNRPENLHAFA
jgi:hypothetical protein